MSATSVVIAAYADERWPHTVHAVTSAQNQAPPPLEVILVIDHNPGLAARARSELSGVTVRENTGPRGASAARNTGVWQSSGSIVAFLDDDQSAVGVDWLQCLCRHFADERVVGVGGRILPEWGQQRPRWFPPEFDWVVGGSYAGLPDEAAPVRNVWGGNTAIRRSALDAVGGFRAGFGKTGAVSRPEDTDLCLRIQRAMPDRHWLYEPAAAVSHRVPEERRTPVYFVRRCWDEGRGKAALARFIGMSASTSSERRYTARVLPRALSRECRTGLRERDLRGLACGLAILVGFFTTAAGWLTEMVIGSMTVRPRRP
jgi:GT2 family glycosyltransferase